MLLSDRVAIITGSALGIGKATAVKFSEEGCAVTICDIAEAAGEKTANEISARGGRCLFVHCDVTNGDQVQEMVNRTIEKFGKVDILVNCAGGVSGAKASGEGERKAGGIENISEWQWDKIVNLNLKSQFFTCKAVIPHMKAQKYGKIVNLSSMGAIHPPDAIAHYHAAKGGVIGLTSNLAFELAPFNICVNAILPGPVRSEFFSEILSGVNQADSEAFFNMLAKKVPLRRMGKPEDIAGVALFLASGLSDYVTGEAINAGGGLPLTPE
ncbi:MAG: SDR family oxidoreductase [Dehalococcoidales bacterium]|nr:SDR family oxidoreductase [Dehalococcoidales bacterium]